METKVFKKLVLLAGLLLGTYSITHTAAAPSETIAKFLDPESTITRQDVFDFGHQEDFESLSQEEQGIILDRAINTFNDDIQDLFMHAIAHQFLWALRPLIEKGADVDLDNGRGRTPLDMASLNENVKLVEILMAHSEQTDFTPYYNNLLYYHAENGLLDRIPYLIERGAHVNHLYRFGPATALHAAAQNGHLPVVTYLVEQAGAKIDLTNEFGPSAIETATRNGHLEIAEFLLPYHSHINPDTIYNQVFQYVVRNGNLEQAQTMIQNHKIDLNHVDQYGNTLLHYTTQQANLEMTNLLIAHGALINQINERGRTPLDQAILSFLINLFEEEAINRENTETVCQLLINQARNILMHKCPATECIESREPTCLLEQTLPLEVAELIPAWLAAQDVASLRSASTNCQVYARHEFEQIKKLRALKLKEALINFIKSAINAARTALDDFPRAVAVKTPEYNEEKKALITFLQQELEKAEQLDLLSLPTQPAARALRADINSEDGEGVAGPPEDQHTGCALVRRQAEEVREGIEDGAPFYGCAIARQQRDAELARQQQNTTAAAVAIAADRALRAQQDAEYAASLAADQQRDRDAAAAHALALVAPQAPAAIAIGQSSQEESEDGSDAPSLEELRARRFAALGQDKGKEEERK